MKQDDAFNEKIPVIIKCDCTIAKLSVFSYLPNVHHPVGLVTVLILVLEDSPTTFMKATPSISLN